MITITLWLFNIAMENDPFIDDFPIETSIYSGFSMVMLNNQRVTLIPRNKYTDIIDPAPPETIVFILRPSNFTNGLVT